jgi:hypothetical protein
MNNMPYHSYVHENENENNHFIYSCHNTTCNDCLMKYINTNETIALIKKPDYDTHSISCPYPNCKSRFLIKNFMDINTFVNLYNVININLSYCISNSCNGKIEDSSCMKCNLKVCMKCHQEKHTGECNDTDLDELHTRLKYGCSTFKRCPNCDDLIFKNEGCESMFCWNCSVTFIWDSGEILSRFDFTGKRFYKIYKQALKEGIDLNPNDFEEYSDFSISDLKDYNSDSDVDIEDISTEAK